MRTVDRSHSGRLWARTPACETGRNNSATSGHRVAPLGRDGAETFAIVVAAQVMFDVDAFVVNVALPTIARELHAGATQIEAVIAIDPIAVFLATESVGSAQHALFASLALCALSMVISVAFLTWMRRAVA